MKPDYTFFYATCLSLLFLLNGCNEHGELPGESCEEWKPIEIAACRAQLGADAVTRASGLTEIKTGTLGLYRKATNGYTALNNVLYTYQEATVETAAGWRSKDASQAIYVNASMADIYAVYPYMEIGGAPTNGHSFDGTYVTGMHQQRYYSDSRNEVMISGDKPANNRVPRLELVMQHIYARLSLRIKNASSGKKYVIESLKMRPKAQYVTEAKVDVSVATPMPEQTATSTQEYTFPFEATDAIHTLGIEHGVVDESVEMIWIPQSFTADMEIIIEASEIVNSKKKYWNLTATLPQAHLPKLDPATRYTLSLQIFSSATLTISTEVKEQGWGNATNMGTVSDNSAM